jgi:ABC-type dipeptide/oligopeptide/nickel transport system permease component
MNNREKQYRQDSNQTISKNSFNTMNTKSDPSQTGSPIPFQQGDFASVDTKYESSKTFAETLSFYLLGIILSIGGFYLFITLPVFKDILDNTVLSFAIAFVILIISFIVSYFITKLFTKKYRNRYK